jgi:hypothetical protein
VTGPVQLPDFEVFVNGARLPFPARHDVRAVTVTESLDEPAWFAVELSNWDADRLQVSWSDGTLFALGAALDIRLGSVGDLHPVLLGEVTSLEPVFSAASPPLLTVGGYGYAHRLTRTRRSRSFTAMTDAAIAAQLARESGLRAEVTDTRVRLGTSPRPTRPTGRSCASGPPGSATRSSSATRCCSSGRRPSPRTRRPRSGSAGRSPGSGRA